MKPRALPWTLCRVFHQPEEARPPARPWDSFFKTGHPAPSVPVRRSRHSREVCKHFMQCATLHITRMPEFCNCHRLGQGPM